MRAFAILVLAASVDCGGPGGGDTDDSGIPAIDAAVGTLSDPFYETGAIVDVRLTIAAADLATLDADPFARVYVSGRFEALGQVVDNVGIRYKGNSSLARAGTKKSFNVDMNEYVADQRFLGRNEINLNNTVLDPSMEREVSAYELFRELGVIAPRANYARVYVNDEYWGLYVNVEEVDKRFLARTFADNDGNLYKQSSTASLEYRGALPTAYDDGTYRKQTNEIANDWSDLIALCELLASNDMTRIERELPPRLDVGRYLRWLAANTYLSHIDAYTGFANNYYLYRDPTSGRFVYIPWDLDITFGTAGHGGTTTEYLLDWNIYDPQVPSPVGMRPMLTKVLAVPAFRAQYTSVLVELLADGGLVAGLPTKLTQRRDLIQSAALDDPRKPYTDAEFTSTLDGDVLATGGSPPPVIGIRRFVTERTPRVRAQLP